MGKHGIPRSSVTRDGWFPILHRWLTLGVAVSIGALIFTSDQAHIILQMR